MDARTDPVGERKHVTVDGFRMGYVEAGTGSPPVILPHGIPTNACLRRKVVPTVSRGA